MFSFSAPRPTEAVTYVANKCVDVRKNHHKTKWFLPWGPNQCKKIRDFDEAISKQIEANDIVFSIHAPHPPNEMSPWFQFMLYVLQVDIAFKMDNQITSAMEFRHEVDISTMKTKHLNKMAAASMGAWAGEAEDQEQQQSDCKSNGGHSSAPEEASEACSAKDSNELELEEQEKGEEDTEEIQVPEQSSCFFKAEDSQ
uniref:Uncharacterized protein n=1 Tax=Sphaerodactylus townsendi TaxID=933632 RepID=A0ACB8F3E9_9SAUR